MSACWGSEMRRGGSTRSRGGWVGALLVAVLSLLPVLVLAQEESRARVVRHVRIGPAGIRVEEYGRGDSLGRHVRHREDRSGAVIKVGRHGVTVVTPKGDSVEAGGQGSVRGPGLVVEAGNAGLVRLFADARVPADQTIQGDVVAVFGSVDVAGAVEGDVVAVFGSVVLHPGARVEGDAVAIGGVLDHPPGAQVSGQSVALGFFLPGWAAPTLAMLVAGIVVGWIITLFLGWLLALLIPDRMRRIGATASRHTAGSFFLGLLSAPLFVITLVLLFITVVGIPFALLLPLVYMLAIWAGQIAASYVLGCKLLRRRPGEGGLMGPVVAGTLLVALLFVAGAALAVPEGPMRTLSLFFSLLGVLLVVGLSIIGTGALILSRVGSRSAEPGSVATPPLPAPAVALPPGPIAGS